MSKKTKLSEDAAHGGADEANASSNAHVFLKIVALLLLAGIVAGFFAPVYFSFSNGKFALQSGSILGGEASLFTYLTDTVRGFMSSDRPSAYTFLQTVWQNSYLFGIAAVGILLVIITIITFCTKKAAPVWFRIGCVISFVLFAVYGGARLFDATPTFDIVMITGALAAVFMIVHAIAAGKKKSLVPILSLILLVVAAVFSARYSFFASERVLCFSAAGYFLEIAKNAVLLLVNGTQFSAPVTETYELISYIAFALLIVNIVLTVFQMGFIKTNGFTVFRYLVQLGVTVAAMVMTILAVDFNDLMKDLMPFIVFTACVFLACLFSLIAVCTRKGKKTAKETDAEEEEMDAAIAQPAAAQPSAPAQSYYQPVPYQAAPIYININPNGVTTGSAETQTAPVSVPVSVSSAAPVPVAVQSASVRESSESAAVAVSEANEPVKEKSGKKRSFCAFLAMLLAVAAAAVFVYHYLDVIRPFFESFAFNNFTNRTFLLTGGFALAVLIGVIFSVIALAKPSKGCAFFAFLFYAAGTAACLAYMQLEQNGIIDAFTSFDWLPIIVMVCAALSVLFSFIAVFVTRGIKKEKETVKEEPAPAAKTEPAKEEPAPAVKAEPAKEEEPAPAAEAELAKEEPAPAAKAEPAKEEETETDLFLRTLSPANKREFTKVFIEGKAPGYLPKYKIGGDNARFFDAVFVYLGKTRYLISDSLLGDIYDFMMDNK